MESSKDSRSDIQSVEIVTTPRLFREAWDDCFEDLHPARFLRGSLADPKTFWGLVPVKHDPPLSSINLDHLALQV